MPPSPLILSRLLLQRPALGIRAFHHRRGGCQRLFSSQQVNTANAVPLPSPSPTPTKKIPFPGLDIAAKQSIISKVGFIPGRVEPIIKALNIEEDREVTAEEMGSYLAGKSKAMLPGLIYSKLGELVCYGAYPKACLSILHYFSKENLINRRCLYPAVKLLAMIRGRIDSTTAGSAPFTELICHLNKEVETIPTKSVQVTMQLLLKACDDSTDGFSISSLTPTEFSDLLEKASLFHLLGSIAIRRSNLKELRSICDRLNVKETFYSHDIYPLHLTLLECIKKVPAVKQDEMMELYMDNLVNREKPLTQEEFEKWVKPALKKHGRWNLQLAKFNSLDPLQKATCDVCGNALESAHELSEEEHIRLKSSLQPLLTDPNNKYRVFSEQELSQFISIIKRLRLEKRDNDARRPLVIDALNVFYKRKNPNNQHTWPMLELIKRFKEMDFHPMVAVLKSGNSPAMKQFVYGLQQIGVIICKCEHGSLDDIFAIEAAQLLGPRTCVISNDEFIDHVNALPYEDQSLFYRWYTSNVIHFSKNFKPYMPTSYSKSVQRSHNGGYHVFIEPAYDLGEPFKLYCLRRRRE